MKIQSFPGWILLIFIILISQNQSHATQKTQPVLDNLTIESFANKTLQWRSSHHEGNKLELSTSTVLAGVLSFIAASISSAGGIGGGGLFIPILTIVACLDLKTATSFSAFMVTGGSVANVMYNLGTKSAKFGGKSLIDYDIALLSEPCMLLGVSVGVFGNLALPEWLITVMFAVFLVWCTVKTCENGVGFWKMESGQHLGARNGYGMIENGTCDETKTTLEEPLVGVEAKGSPKFPWKKLLVLIIVWFSFFVTYLLRGNRYGQILGESVGSMLGRDLEALMQRAMEYQKEYGDSFVSVEHLIFGFTQDRRFGKQLFKDFQISNKVLKSAIESIRGRHSVTDQETMQGVIQLKPCGIGYWALSLFQIPLAVAFTAWILRRKDAIACQGPNEQGVNKLIFPLMGLVAGALGGVFGIGGGMLISPLLLKVGVAPEVTAATCSFMVFFSSTMSAFQYLLLGMDHIGTALIFSVICFVASLLGLVVVQKAIKQFGRASLIVFSVGIVMALSAILMTSFGALDVWEDYTSGSYMGFKLPC